MLYNYHTHTFRNHHSTGTEREYIETAISCGFHTLGFSEHAPYRFQNGYVSAYHLQPADLPDYARSILALKEEYAGRVEILLGYEAEFYPALFDDLLSFIKSYPVDYMILGQHFSKNEYDGLPYGAATKERAVLQTYVDQCIAGLQTGCFTYLAHPDLVDFRGEDAVYEDEMRRLCVAAKELDIPLEINVLGLRTGRCYPSERFFCIAKSCGNTIIAGLDAHDVGAIYQPEYYAPYHKLVTACSLDVTDTPALRSLY